MKKRIFILVISFLLPILVACDHTDTSSSAENIELTVSAAVSMTDVLEDIQQDYEKNNSVSLTFNLGSSGTLAQQIEQGAPVDVFISASQNWMDILEDKDEIQKNTRQDIIGNQIVFITNVDNPSKLNKIEELNADNIGQIAIGNPESVPAGKYTKQTLENMKKWDELENTFIMSKNVRQVLTYVESKNVEVGFVYGSDASTSDNVAVIDSADDTKDHDPIVYPAAILNQSKHKDEAKAFITYLKSEKGQEKFEQYGFIAQ